LLPSPGLLPQKRETRMLATYRKEIAAGLMTMSVALTLVSVPSSYTLPSSAGVLGLSVSGSPNSGVGMTVAIPVSGVSTVSEQTAKPHRHGPTRKKTGS
jgi:hypothetical protein